MKRKTVCIMLLLIFCHLFVYASEEVMVNNYYEMRKVLNQGNIPILTDEVDPDIAKAYNKAVNVIESLELENDSEAIKFYKIAYWIQNNVTRPANETQKLDPNSPLYDPTIHNIVGFMLNGQAVCDGYSSGSNLLFTLAGFEILDVSGSQYLVTGKVQGHAWNKIKLNGVWYNLDHPKAYGHMGFYSTYMHDDRNRNGISYPEITVSDTLPYDLFNQIQTYRSEVEGLLYREVPIVIKLSSPALERTEMAVYYNELTLLSQEVIFEKGESQKSLLLRVVDGVSYATVVVEQVNNDQFSWFSNPSIDLSIEVPSVTIETQYQVVAQANNEKNLYYVRPFGIQSKVMPDNAYMVTTNIGKTGDRVHIGYYYQNNENGLFGNCYYDAQGFYMYPTDDRGYILDETLTIQSALSAKEIEENVQIKSLTLKAPEGLGFGEMLNFNLRLFDSVNKIGMTSKSVDVQSGDQEIVLEYVGIADAFEGTFKPTISDIKLSNGQIFAGKIEKIYFGNGSEVVAPLMMPSDDQKVVLKIDQEIQKRLSADSSIEVRIGEYSLQSPPLYNYPFWVGRYDVQTSQDAYTITLKGEPRNWTSVGKYAAEVYIRYDDQKQSRALFVGEDISELLYNMCPYPESYHAIEPVSLSNYKVLELNYDQCNNK